ncbi:TMEM254 family protein [Calothrix sp. UHCC 0171]|uniref:TMEM254 family protein n=1 Tax=Calothrix sp. UHCC 0171 TaxID=3110245 RepID=UPI002B21FAC8|nr:DUF4499 domain-containing protein [Calothrix sp. UHCC 0171]MEA5574232.1 DUF4499 domain-containing protein [Calothrix sp. UHCC 0171]
MMIFTFVKIISIVVMLSAIALELWNLYAFKMHTIIPSSLNVFLWLGIVAILAHFMEAVIAFVYAPSKNQKPLQYGIYTFFVGTVALVELFAENKS